MVEVRKGGGEKRGGREGREVEREGRGVKGVVKGSEGSRRGKGAGEGGGEGRRPRSHTGLGVQDPTPAAERTWTQLSPAS